MSKIITLQDGLYQYRVPIKEPTDEKEIINHQFKKKDDQYWRTPKMPDVKKMSASDRIRFIERERQRWEEGAWVLINGDLEYLTGMHYDHLTYMTFKVSQKAEFFYHQLFDFYFRDLTRRSPKCDGRAWMKPRRYGMTMEEITEATYSLLENEANFVGLQSDTPDKAITTLMQPINSSYVKRPFWMRSDYYKPQGRILIKKLSLESSLAPDDFGSTDNFLEGWIMVFKTLPRAMDGNEMVYIVMDEAWKWQTSSPKEVLESNLKVLHGRNRHGKLSLLSTMGDSDDYIKAVMDGCDIIARSNPRILDQNGNTLSKLWEYFVPAIYSFDIPPDVFEVNKFGRVNAEKHLEYINNIFKGMDKKSKSYVFEKRRMPLVKSDALMSSNTATNFRRVVINDRLTELRGLLPEKKPYVRGELVDLPNGRVKFVSDAERQKIAGEGISFDPGIWIFSVLPYFSIEKGIDARNRFRKTDAGIYLRPINPEGAIGYDPIDYPKSQTTSQNLSQAAIVVKKKFDYFNKPEDKDYFADGITGLCLFRPDDPHDANKEAMKACRFTGFPCMHERSVSHVYEDFRDEGMLSFLLQHKKVYGISPSDIKAKKDGLGMLQTRYAAPKNPEDRDQLAEYPFEDGLTQLDNFDIGGTTPFDVTMAEIYAEHGLAQIVFTNQTDSELNAVDEAIKSIIAKRN